MYYNYTYSTEEIHVLRGCSFQQLILLVYTFFVDFMLKHTFQNELNIPSVTCQFRFKETVSCDKINLLFSRIYISRPKQKPLLC
jgi:hypothetical protein